MRFALQVFAFAAALSLAAPAARAQDYGGAPRSALAPPVAAAAVARPLPAGLVPRAAAAETSAVVGEAAREEQERRSRWRYPAVGALAGALAGAVFGTAVMVASDEWMAVPAHAFTVPAGAVLGLALGGVANRVDPR